MTRAFYRTYRPQKFSDLIGQDLIRLTLRQSVIENRIASAYLFSGPRGTGKTTTARILAKAVNCTTPLSERKKGDPCDKCSNCIMLNEGKTLDLIEIDAASHTGVDNIRSLTENIDLSPSKLAYRVFIIDEVHMLSKGAFNALLKTLEEPPEHVIFILATTEQHKVPPTIGSRCQKFSFRLLKIPEIREKLKKIAKKEEIEVDEESLSLISETAQGGMRDAESLFFQIVSLAGKKVNAEKTAEILGISGKEKELNILKKLFQGDMDFVLNEVQKSVGLGADVFLLSHNLLAHLRKIIFIKVEKNAQKILEQESSENEIAKLGEIAGVAGLMEVIDLMGKIIQAQPQIKTSSLSSLPLELAFIDWAVSRGKIKMDGKELQATVIKAEDKKTKEESVKSNEIAEMIKPIKTEKIEAKKKKKDQKEEKETSFAKATVVEVEELAGVYSHDRVSPLASAVAQSGGLATAVKKNADKIGDFNDVLQNWNKIIQSIRKVKPALSSLLKVCSPIKIEGEILIIATPYKFHKDKLNNVENKQAFCIELEKAVGLRKICIVEDKTIEIKPAKNKDVMSQIQSLL